MQFIRKINQWLNACSLVIENWWTIKKSSCAVLEKTSSLFWFFVKTASAFCLLALFLFGLESCNKSWYENVTYWANQKSAPTVEGCIFKKQFPSPFPEEKEYDYYEVIIKTNMKDDEIGSAIIYPNLEHMIMIDNKNVSQDYVVVWKMPIQLLKTNVRIENKFINYRNEKKFNKYNCPLKVKLMFDE